MRQLLLAAGLMLAASHAHAETNMPGADTPVGVNKIYYQFLALGPKWGAKPMTDCEANGCHTTMTYTLPSGAIVALDGFDVPEGGQASVKSVCLTQPKSAEMCFDTHGDVFTTRSAEEGTCLDMLGQVLPCKPGLSKGVRYYREGWGLPWSNTPKPHSATVATKVRPASSDCGKAEGPNCE
jgi:hypothetical protein